MAGNLTAELPERRQLLRPYQLYRPCRHRSNEVDNSSLTPLPRGSIMLSQTHSPVLRRPYIQLSLDRLVGSRDPAAVAHRQTITKISSLIGQGGTMSLIERILRLLISIMADLLETQDLMFKHLQHLRCLKYTFMVYVDLRKIIRLQ